MMQRIQHYLPILLSPFILLSLTSCAGLMTPSPPPAYQVILPGATLTLHRELNIPPGSAGVIIQGNRTGSYSEVNSWYPSCRMELRTVKETPQFVIPDTFTIWRVTRETEYVSSGNIMLASRSGFALGGDYSGPMAEIYRTYLYINSPTQPNVMRFMCEYWGDLTEGWHLTVKQIQQAFGDYATLNLYPQ